MKINFRIVCDTLHFFSEENIYFIPVRFSYLLEGLMGSWLFRPFL